MSKLSAAKGLHQNPYMFAGEESGDEELPDIQQAIFECKVQRLFKHYMGGATFGAVKSRAAAGSMSDTELERVARALHRAIRAAYLEDGVDVSDPFFVVNPATALNAFGFTLEERSSLGQFDLNRRKYEVAGSIDQQAKKVFVSNQFEPAVQRFTIAHELAHWLLHDIPVMHRDIGVDHSDSVLRAPIERTADKLATYLLMPARLVSAEFKSRFLTDRLNINELTRFALFGTNAAVESSALRSRRDLSRFLAAANSYNGVHFKSLATQFGVSNKAMAIRLEELGLL